MPSVSLIVILVGILFAFSFRNYFPYFSHTPTPVPIQDEHNVTILDQEYGDFGLVSVVELTKNDYQLRALFHGKSILGGYWKVEGHVSIFCAFDIMELSLYAISEPRNALIIGLGVGTFVKRFIDKKIVCDVVEIDPLVVKYASQHFGFSSNGKVIIEDALLFLERNAVSQDLKSHYDIIVHDVFAGDMTTDLFTFKMFSIIQQLLSENGIFVLNFVGDPNSLRASMMYNTLRQLWKNVRCIFDETPDATSSHIGNMVFFTSQSKIAFSVPSHVPRNTVRYSRDWVLTHFDELEIHFDSRNYENVPIASSNNRELIQFDQASKDKFWQMMLDLFPQEVWDKISSNVNVNKDK